MAFSAKLVKDAVIEENNGYFCWKTGPEESSAERLTEEPKQVDLELTVGELTSMIFEGFKISKASNSKFRELFLLSCKNLCID